MSSNQQVETMGIEVHESFAEEIEALAVPAVQKGEVTISDAIGFDLTAQVVIDKKVEKDQAGNPVEVPLYSTVEQAAETAIKERVDYRRLQLRQGAFMSIVFDSICERIRANPGQHPTDVVMAVCSVWEQALHRSTRKGGLEKAGNVLKNRVAVIKSTCKAGTAMGIIPGQTSAKLTYSKLVRGKPGTPPKRETVTETFVANTYNAVRQMSENWTPALTNEVAAKYPQLTFTPPKVEKTPIAEVISKPIGSPVTSPNTVNRRWSQTHEAFVMWTRSIPKNQTEDAIARFNRFLKNEAERLANDSQAESAKESKAV